MYTLDTTHSSIDRAPAVAIARAVPEEAIDHGAHPLLDLVAVEPAAPALLPDQVAQEGERLLPGRGLARRQGERHQLVGRRRVVVTREGARAWFAHHGQAAEPPTPGGAGDRAESVPAATRRADHAAERRTVALAFAPAQWRQLAIAMTYAGSAVPPGHRPPQGRGVLLRRGRPVGVPRRTAGHHPGPVRAPLGRRSLSR